jgi:membrane protein required for colicin V production
MEMDLFLVVLLAGGFLVGFLRGVMRQLIALAAWVVCFVVAAQLQRPVANWYVEQDPQYSLQYIDMLAFGVIFILLFGIALVVIEVAGNVSDLTTHPALDEVLGGILAAGVVLLAIASVIVILNTYYSLESPSPTAQVGILTDVHGLFERSAIAGWLSDSLIPGLGSLLGLVLPEGVRRVMG